MTDAERMREIIRLQAELNAAEAEAAAKVEAIKNQINELCGIATMTMRKRKTMTSADFLAIGRASAGGHRERVA